MTKIAIRIETSHTGDRVDRRVAAVGVVDLDVTPHYQYVTDGVLVTVDVAAVDTVADRAELDPLRDWAEEAWRFLASDFSDSPTFEREQRARIVAHLGDAIDGRPTSPSTEVPD